MTDLSHSQPRALAPRRLEQQENLQSLNQWKSVFRNYYRRCPYNSFFLQPTTSWDNSESRGFTAPEPSGLKRDALTLAADLDGFLECVGSYCPFDYVSDKLKSESRNVQSVWDILFEIYDLELNTSNYMDYATMTRDTDETYRGYFNRLVGFVRQHLPRNAVHAEGVSSPNTGEELTIALLDSIAIHWLLNIDKKLVGIVKTEFAAELKTKRLCQMVKTIAQNIDELLLRYNSKDQVSLVQTPPQNVAQPSTNDMSALIQRIERLEVNNKKNNRRKKQSMPNQFQYANQCSHCLFINKQLGSTLKTDHSNTNCGKKNVSISLVESLGTLSSCTESSSDCNEGDGGYNTLYLTQSLQTDSECQVFNPDVQTAARHSRPSLLFCESDSPNLSNINNKVAAVSEKFINIPKPVRETTLLSTDSLFSEALPGTNNSIVNDQTPVIAASSSSFVWNQLDKSESPKIKCHHSGRTFHALIDSGAEINALDKALVDSLGIGITTTNESARAANLLPLDICGQTQQAVTILCDTDMGPVSISLGIVLVILNLGTSCLIGEPGKKRNNIICLPKHKLVVFASGDKPRYVPYSSDAPKYSLVRAAKSTTILPGEHMDYSLPENLRNELYVSIVPRPSALQWLTPSILQASSGSIRLVNSSTVPVTVNKADHVADVRDTVLMDIKPSCTLLNPVHGDTFQFTDFSTKRPIDLTNLEQIQVDPDMMLTQSERDISHKLHERFSALFTQQPGKYNGHHGYINNKLQFSTLPPPNTKTRIPNYSPPMNKILAEKMDALEEWGVLAVPEKLGINVEFISPSMLVPKPDSKEYRLVTDFSALNVYLKKVPNTSATIQQAKSRIARAQFVVHLDLANYFYQCGLQQEDVKYLGTIHPFKGVRVYTCDPQGLKGASERSYEKLVRIYGDLIQSGKLAQMADGLHVLGSTIQELAQNYVEVLNRAELCGLTFKPSKVIVCPRNIKLFGWELRDHVWHPTAHTISALVNAPRPITVKQMRSFL